MRVRALLLGFVAIVVVAGAGCTPPPPAGTLNAVAIDAGASHTCAVVDDGTISCWGRADLGQLGNGSFLYTSAVPLTVTGLTDAVAIAAGWSHSCALLDDGTARCWGRNDLGQLGNGHRTNSNVPVTVTGLTDAVAITAGGNHTCALLDDGTARCWGYNDYGQLGNGTTTNSTRAGDRDRAHRRRRHHRRRQALVCAARRRHRPLLGRNESGQLGNGTTTDSNVPVTVSGLTDAVAITAGARPLVRGAR